MVWGTTPAGLKHTGRQRETLNSDSVAMEASAHPMQSSEAELAPELFQTEVLELLH